MSLMVANHLMRNASSTCIKIETPEKHFQTQHSSKILINVLKNKKTWLPVACAIIPCRIENRSKFSEFMVWRTQGQTEEKLDMLGNFAWLWLLNRFGTQPRPLINDILIMQDSSFVIAFVVTIIYYLEIINAVYRNTKASCVVKSL